MNRHRIEIGLQQSYSRIRRQHSQYSDERSDFICGKYDPLVSCLQESYDISADEAGQLLEQSIGH